MEVGNISVYMYIHTYAVLIVTRRVGDVSQTTVRMRSIIYFALIRSRAFNGSHESTYSEPNLHA